MILSRYTGFMIIILAIGCYIMPGCKTVSHNAAVSGPGQQAAAVTEITYSADTSMSYIRWTGSRPGRKHYGTLHLRSGGLAVTDGHITGGRFEIAVNSLSPQDQRRKGNELLRQHLLGEDFFDAEKYPVILFEIVAVEPSGTAKTDYMMSGNLKLQEVSKSISFPAGIIIKNGKLTADAGFSFNRADWGLSYGNDKSLGNWFIKPSVAIILHLEARKI